jgi:predicted Zn-dependent protease
VNARITELRRRIEKDPASIVFAQLAEEHRRAGDFEDAIRVCRAGLVHHPGYLSARVTLGRALLETGAFDEARTELESVLRAAPDNLGAIRALSDLHHRREEQSFQEPARVAEPVAPIAEPERRPLDEARGALSHVEGRIVDPVLVELESWLAAIMTDRQRRIA